MNALQCTIDFAAFASAFVTGRVNDCSGGWRNLLSNRIHSAERRPWSERDLPPRVYSDRCCEIPFAPPKSGSRKLTSHAPGRRGAREQPQTDGSGGCTARADISLPSGACFRIEPRTPCCLEAEHAVGTRRAPPGGYAAPARFPCTCAGGFAAAARALRRPRARLAGSASVRCARAAAPSKVARGTGAARNGPGDKQKLSCGTRLDAGPIPSGESSVRLKQAPNRYGTTLNTPAGIMMLRICFNCS
jgi:hypothetical protein